MTFEATRTVSSEPFDANEAKLKQWFGESDAVAALCSMADEFKELPSDQVEIVSRIRASSSAVASAVACFAACAAWWCASR